MMRRIMIGLAVLGLGAAMPAVAFAEPRQISSSPSKSWVHKGTGIALPTSLGGEPRKAIYDLTTGEWDVIAQYEKPDRSTIITVYIYQSSVATVPIAFAQARRAISINEMRNPGFVGTFDPATPTVAFAPVAGGTASGLRVSFASSGSYKSTALAIAPMGRDTLVKLRVSSKTLDKSGMDALLNKIIADLSLPKDAVSQPAAVEVADCPDAMPQFKTTKDAKSSNSGGASILGALVGLASSDDAAKSGAPLRPTFCRSGFLGSAEEGFAQYRILGGSEYYLVSLVDNGTVMVVASDRATEILQAEDGAKNGSKPSYSIQLFQPGSITNYVPQDGMPSPQQALSIIEANRWVTRTGVGKKDSKIEVNSNMMK